MRLPSTASLPCGTARNSITASAESHALLSFRKIVKIVMSDHPDEPHIPEGKNAKLNVDNLIDNSLIQELDKEGFLREIDAVKR